jgi:hypothetical protein
VIAARIDVSQSQVSPFVRGSSTVTSLSWMRRSFSAMNC